MLSFGGLAKHKVTSENKARQTKLSTLATVNLDPKPPDGAVIYKLLDTAVTYNSLSLTDWVSVTPSTTKDGT